MLLNQERKGWLKISDPSWNDTHLHLPKRFSSEPTVTNTLTINLSSPVDSLSKCHLHAEIKPRHWITLLITLIYECQWHPEGQNPSFAGYFFSHLHLKSARLTAWFLLFQVKTWLRWWWWCLRTKHAVRSLSKLSVHLSFTRTTAAYMDKMINHFNSTSHYF